jgi:PAT family beta-lactamase induction signal transducer AmpG
MSAVPATSPLRVPHPSLFAILLYPFGAVSGYLTVTVAFNLAHNNVSALAIGTLMAVAFIPNTWKFLWSPVVDVTFTPKLWYTVAALMTGIGIVAMGLIKADEHSLLVLNIVVVLASLASTFTSMSAEIIAVQVAPFEQKGRFGGWMQVGNFIGGGVGGTIGLELSERVSNPWVSGSVVGLTCLLCPLALLFLPNVIHHAGDERVLLRVKGIARSAWSLVRSRAGALAIVVLFLPMSTGAASGLWAGFSKDWNAGADAVAYATGAWSGVVSGIGCLLGGYFADKIDRKWSYSIFGLMQAACAVGMGLAPKTEMMFVVFTLLYALTSGLTYASFSAVALEVAGVAAAATTYNLLASLSNMPIQYMTLVDTGAHELWGPSGMLYTEAAICVLAVVAYRLILKFKPLTIIRSVSLAYVFLAALCVALTLLADPQHPVTGCDHFDLIVSGIHCPGFERANVLERSASSLADLASALGSFALSSIADFGDFWGLPVLVALISLLILPLIFLSYDATAAFRRWRRAS